MGCDRNPTLDLVRVIGIVFVMFIHSPVNGDLKSAPEILFFKSFITGGAVPAFFVLSGYLGARKIGSKTVGVWAYTQEKFRTLVVPFLFWNGLVILLILAIKCAGLESALRGSGAYFDISFSVSSIFAALLGIGRYPIVYQLWFVRDLIIVVFLALFICRWLPRIPLFAWFLLFIPVPVASSLGFYFLGHQLSSSLPSGKFSSPRSAVLYCVCWLVMGGGVIAGFIDIPGILLNIGSAVFIFMLAIAASGYSFGVRLATLGPAVFFIYATHEPLQTILGKLWQASHLPGFGTLFCFLIIPGIVFFACLGGYLILMRLVPRVMSFATGGR